MKIKYNLLIESLFVILMISVVSCTKLNEKIFDESVDTSLIKDSTNAPGLVNPAYASLRALNNLWNVFGLQEAGTDEIQVPTRGTDWYDNGSWTGFYLHKVTPQHAIDISSWNTVMQGMSRANTGIYYLGKFPPSPNINEDIIELRFLRAYYVYLCNDFWGQTPFRKADDQNFSVPPKVMGRTAATTWLITELKAIIPLMKTKSQLPFGRATKAAAQTLLAKVYLNQKVYTGTADWADVITECNDVINSGDYTIAPDYWAQFQYNNPDTEEGIFMTIHNDSYDVNGGVWVNYTLHYNQVFGNYTSLWNGACITQKFWNTWKNTDATDSRKYDDRIKSVCGFNQGFLVGQQYSPAGVALTTRQGAPLIFTPAVNFTNASEAMGIRVVKFAPNPQTTNQFAEGNIYYTFRISDVYLMRAEAEFRSGNTSAALADVNAIRVKRNATPRTSLTLDDIYNERGYELYWEGKRRQDMIRFGHYNEAYGTKPVTPATSDLFPIPQNALDVNPNLVQNPGY